MSWSWTGKVSLYQMSISLTCYYFFLQKNSTFKHLCATIFCLPESNSENGVTSLNPLTLTRWRNGRGEHHPDLALVARTYVNRNTNTCTSWSDLAWKIANSKRESSSPSHFSFSQSCLCSPCSAHLDVLLKLLWVTSFQWLSKNAYKTVDQL